MAAESTTTTLAGAIFSDYVANQIIEVLAAKSVVAPFVRRFDASATKSKTFSIPVGAATAGLATITEATDMTSTAQSMANVDVTMGMVGEQIFLPGIAEQLTTVAVADFLVGEMSNELARKYDTDLITEAVNGISANVGSTGTALTFANFMLAGHTLYMANVSGPYGAWLNPKQYKDILDDVYSASGSAINYGRLDLMPADATGYRGNLYGIEAYQTTLVASDGTDHTGFVGALGNLSPLALVIWRAANIEIQRDASRSGGGNEYNLTAAYGVKTVKAAAGVKVISVD